MVWMVRMGVKRSLLDSLILVSHFHKQDSTSWQWLPALQPCWVKPPEKWHHIHTVPSLLPAEMALIWHYQRDEEGWTRGWLLRVGKETGGSSQGNARLWDAVPGEQICPSLAAAAQPHEELLQ